MGWKLRRRKWTGTTERLIEDLKLEYGGNFQRYPGRIYVEGHVDIFDMIDIYLFSVIWAKQDGSSIRLYRLLPKATAIGYKRCDEAISFKETELDREAGFGNVAGSGIESSREDVEQGNGKEDESTPSDEKFFYDDERIGTSYESQYDVQYSEDVSIDDDDDDLLVDEENEIVESDVDVHLFGISMDVPFDNIGVTNLVPNDVLKGEDVDVINADGFDSDLGMTMKNIKGRQSVAEI
ncbi:hypothetical protein Tco_1555187 [Tanacetum coccineum]